ncbi:MAG TPA: peptidylprolyl isomerase [Tepidisphaeraceae bacterium]|nr:peptidylprolyl isomerase [Tepidisphaeraceae bacterium]
MRSKKRILRVILIVAVTAAVSMPLLNQLRSSRAIAQPTSSGADPLGNSPKGVAIAAFPQVDPGKVVITVGDQKITAGEFNDFFTQLDPSVQSQIVAHPEAKRQLVERFVDMKLLAAEAKRLKLDDTTKVRTMYEQMLANAAMLHIEEQKDANEKFFNDNKDWFDELQVRHILIGVKGGPVTGAMLSDAQAKAKAQEIKKQLDKGADFANLARANSDDKGSAAVGGSLGPAPMTRGQMVPAFEQSAFSLKKNQISEPVKTQFGYHIIQVLNRISPTYQEASQRVASRRAEVMLEQMKKDAKPEIDDSYFGAPLPKPGEPDAPQAPTASGAAGSSK